MSFSPPSAGSQRKMPLEIDRISDSDASGPSLSPAIAYELLDVVFENSVCTTVLQFMNVIHDDDVFRAFSSWVVHHATLEAAPCHRMRQCEHMIP